MPAALKIESMREMHLEKVSEIENSVSPHPWTFNQFRQSLSRQCCYVLLIDNRVQGYLIYSLVAGESELFNIAIAKTQQGYGYGRKLLQYYFKQISGRATKALLEVRSDNDVAISLYQQTGYTMTGRRKDYYKIAGLPVDALLMTLDLQKTSAGHP